MQKLLIVLALALVVVGCEAPAAPEHTPQFLQADPDPSGANYCELGQLNGQYLNPDYAYFGSTFIVNATSETPTGFVYDAARTHLFECKQFFRTAPIGWRHVATCSQGQMRACLTCAWEPDLFAPGSIHCSYFGN
jgi:hypothetical protein